MRQPSKTVIIFALLGLLVASAVYLNALFYDYGRPMSGIQHAVGIATFIFCPPTLLFVLCIDCEADAWSGVFVFSIIGLLNAVLYGLIGTVVVAKRKKSL